MATGMKKTSVYLPDALKARLAEVAAASGRSEAQLIRSAIERIVAVAPAVSRPAETPLADPVVDRHRTAGAALIGVGVGPGDPALVTVRALAVLRGADRVLAPTSSTAAIGRAEVIVREAAPEVVVERVPFVMEVDGAARAAALDAAAARVVAALDAGERIAFITLGDPNVYSTFSALVDAVRVLRPAAAVETVPGIMAFQDLAARAGAVLVDGDERLVLAPARSSDGVTAVGAAAADPDTAVVIYKGGGRLPEVAAALAAAGRSGDAVVGELLGMPGGRVVKLDDLDGQPASYLATVVVPPPRREQA